MAKQYGKSAVMDIYIYVAIESDFGSYRYIAIVNEIWTSLQTLKIGKGDCRLPKWFQPARYFQCLTLVPVMWN